MAYVVERYLPGLSRTDLLPGLSKLECAIEEHRSEGPAVRYLGSTIALSDEGCFCHFEGPSEKAVAGANRRVRPAVRPDRPRATRSLHQQER